MEKVMSQLVSHFLVRCCGFGSLYESKLFPFENTVFKTHSDCDLPRFYFNQQFSNTINKIIRHN